MVFCAKKVVPSRSPPSTRVASSSSRQPKKTLPPAKPLLKPSRCSPTPAPVGKVVIPKPLTPEKMSDNTKNSKNSIATVISKNTPAKELPSKLGEKGKNEEDLKEKTEDCDALLNNLKRMKEDKEDENPTTDLESHREERDNKNSNKNKNKKNKDATGPKEKAEKSQNAY